MPRRSDGKISMKFVDSILLMQVASTYPTELYFDLWFILVSVLWGFLVSVLWGVSVSVRQKYIDLRLSADNHEFTRIG